MKLRYQIGQWLFLPPLFLSCVIVAIALIVLAPFMPLFWRYKLTAIWPILNLWTLKHLCGIDHQVEGWENIPKQPVIIFSKHQSTWETFFFVSFLPPAAFVAKSELLWVPFFGWGMKSLRYITINRGSRVVAVEHMSKQAAERLKDGLSIIIFPEGTRREVGAKPRYKIGGGVLAERTGAQVLPVSHNAGLYWPRHFWRKNPGTIRVKIHPPIAVEGLNAAQIVAAAQAVIEAGQAELDGGVEAANS